MMGSVPPLAEAAASVAALGGGETGEVSLAPGAVGMPISWHAASADKLLCVSLPHSSNARSSASGGCNSSMARHCSAI